RPRSPSAWPSRPSLLVEGGDRLLRALEDACVDHAAVFDAPDPARRRVDDRALEVARVDAPERQHRLLAGSVLLRDHAQLTPYLADVVEVGAQAVEAAVRAPAAGAVAGDQHELDVRVDELRGRIDVTPREGVEQALDDLHPLLPRHLSILTDRGDA